MDINKIVFVAAMAVLAVRVYQKYIRKNKISGTPDKKDSFSSSSREEDYEPYSKK